LSNSRAKDEGRIHLLPQFASRNLSTARNLIVYLPPGYETGADRYPVLYLQDGQNLFDPATAFGGQDWRADVTADYLIERREIQPPIMVGLYNTGVERISEYTPTGGQRRTGGRADRYAAMLAREVKPYIDATYRTEPGAAHTAVGGSSLGGLVSLAAGLLYPRVFGSVAILSPSVWWDQQSILKMVERYRSPVRPRISMDAGTAEGDAPQQVIAELRMLRDALLARGWREGVDLRYSEVQGAAHNEDAWGARFGTVLEYLFPAAPSVAGA
jgi:predicted alpha/beta superfamily hydrolase